MAKKAADAVPSQKADPLADAKAAFEQALAKTKAESDDAEPEVEREKAEPKQAQPAHEKELAALREELKELRSSLTSKAREREEPEEDSAPSDFESVQSELVERFGDDEGVALAKAFRALVEPREQRLMKIEAMLEEGMRRGRMQTLKTNRQRLASEYPQLAKNEDAWETVQARAQHLFNKDADKYTTIEEAYDATVEALYGKPSKRELPDEDVELEASRIAASTPTQPGRTKKEKPLSNDQVSRAVFDHLFKNPEDVGGARKLARTLRKTE